ncbi:MAG: hypothetical protein RL693_2361 [Verrucomicrobiota bacterium]|jgi:short-subunit dehydrogenase
METHFNFHGCTAIITGASSGLGAEFARQLAPRVSGLVLAARSEQTLHQLADELRQACCNLHILVCPCDLATDAGRAALWEKVDGLGNKPMLLINNAGLGDYGLFTQAPEARVRQQIDLNITALTVLSHAFVERITPTAENPAAILNVSSLASTVPVPELAVYAATKAYVSSLTEGLAIELGDKHIIVMAVCPGPTPTNFGKNARRETDSDIDRSGQDLLKIPPSRVVATAIHALETGKTLVFPGFLVSLAAWLFRVMPRPILRFFMRQRYRRSQSEK